MCIDDSNTQKAVLKAGEVYTVIEKDSVTYGISVYWFEELEDAYATFRFIPLSDIDETKLVNTKEEAYV